MPANPLVDLGFEIPFPHIRPEHVVPAVGELVARARAEIEAIKAHAGPPTWDATFGAFDRAGEALTRAWTVVEHLHAVCHSDALSAAHDAALPTVTAFYAGIPLDEGLYAALRAYAESEDGRALTGPRRRYVERTLDEFRRQGADLPPEGKARVQAIAAELAELGSRFSTHVVKDTAAWYLDLHDEAQLAGLPPSARAMLRAQAQAAGVEGWRITLAAPVVQAVLTYLDDRGIRERVWRGYHQRCTGGETDNAPIIARMLELRREQAALLGYDDFADYVLAPRMAKTGAAARAFLDGIEARCRDAFARETVELAAFARELDGLPELQPWDVAYYAEKQRRALYDLDEEALRPYFPFPTVLEGLFELVHRLYGVTVRRTELPVWHPTVTTWELIDADGTRLGAFYCDFEPRPEKRQGAWMNALVTGGPQPDGSFAPHLGLVCGNLTPPVDGKPALLTHREVETIFHEFGHLLHHLLSKVPLRGQAGTNVAWDFVELPSQIMENWTWERASLDLVARHVDTGEPIPEDLYQRMLRARNFRSASFFIRQLGFGQTDLALHTVYDPARDGDAVDWGDRILARYAPTRTPERHTILPTFLHLFSSPVGYAAGYYSYLWAAVLDADAFGLFQERGIFDAETGRRFRDLILSRGDSEDPAELFRAFRGRDPDPTAVLRRAGLA